MQAGMLLEALERENKPRAEGEKPLALIVEDAPQASELLRLYIESAGYRVEVAQNGAEAVDMAKRLHPSVITLDLMLPVKDGWQVLKELKRHPLCKHIPVIIVSIADEKNLGFSLGAVDYFVKPVNKEDLIQALDKVYLVRRSDTRKPTVLVIDDDRAATDLIQVILENEGLPGAEGISGDGRDRAGGTRASRPDHPGPDHARDVGFNVAYQLKQIPATRAIPIIILTSMDIDTRDPGAARGVRVGADEQVHVHEEGPAAGDREYRERAIPLAGSEVSGPECCRELTQVPLSAIFPTKQDRKYPPFGPR